MVGGSRNVQEWGPWAYLDGISRGPVRTCGRDSMGGTLAGALSWWRYQLGGRHAVVSSAVPMAGPTLWWHWLRLMLWLQAGTCIPDWRSALL